VNPPEITGRNLFHQFERFLLNSLARSAAGWGPLRRRKVACFVSGFARDLLKIRWTHVVESMKLRLDLPHDRAVMLGRRFYDAFFENALEMASIPYLSGGELCSRVVVDGMEHLRKAHARGKGVVIVTGHYGLWEMLPPWLVHNGFRITIVVRRQKNIEVDDWFEFMRQSHGVETSDSGFSLREILRTLRKGHLLGLMSDQDAGDKGIFVKFFGEDASTVVGPAAIAQKTGAPIVTLAVHPGRPNPPHRIEICPAIFPEDFPGDEIGRKAMTQIYTSILENWIRKHPEHWFWLHRRWKTRPPSALT